MISLFYISSDEHLLSVLFPAVRSAPHVFPDQKSLQCIVFFFAFSFLKQVIICVRLN